jgi:hypothetical protein
MAKTYSRPPKAPEAHAKYKSRAVKAEILGNKTPSADKMPRREMLILWYEAKGYSVVPGRTRKFVTMEHPNRENKIFIGKNGSLMEGKNISSVGWALTDSIKWDVLRKWVNRRIGG